MYKTQPDLMHPDLYTGVIRYVKTWERGRDNDFEQRLCVYNTVITL